MSTIKGTARKDTLNGSSAADVILGLLGDDLLNGLAGNDTLDGGGGKDTLKGGLGNDTYIVDNTGDVVVELAKQGTDLVRSSVSYTLAANVENLTLTGSTSLNANGNTLANVLVGNSGNNVLDGKTGADTLKGGAGNDTYHVDNALDVVTESTGQGTDTVQSSIDWTLGAYLENLLLKGTANLNGTGNAQSNRITGNSGNNVLDGGAGNDTLIGGAGNDTYVVDSAGDVVTEAQDKGTDLVKASVDHTLAANVENLELTGTDNLNGTGNTANNILNGNGGNNVLAGLAGDDILVGNDGDDVLNGGLGADTLNGGSGSDTADYSDRSEPVFVQLSASTPLAEGLFTEGGKTYLIRASGVGDQKNAYLLTDTTKAFDAAQAVAGELTFRGVAGHLATLTSAAENTAVQDNLVNPVGGAPHTAWIGLSDATTEGTFRWVDGPEAGSSISPGFFDTGEPSSTTAAEDYVVITPTGWNDQLVRPGPVGAPGGTGEILSPASGSSDLFLTVWDTITGQGYLRDLGVLASTFFASGENAAASRIFPTDPLFTSLFGAGNTNLQWVVTGAKSGTAGAEEFVTTSQSDRVPNITTIGVVPVVEKIKALLGQVNAETFGAVDSQGQSSVSLPAATSLDLTDNTVWDSNFGGTYGSGFSNSNVDADPFTTPLYFVDIHENGFGPTPALKTFLGGGTSTWTLGAEGSLNYHVVGSTPVPIGHASLVEFENVDASASSGIEGRVVALIGGVAEDVLVGIENVIGGSAGDTLGGDSAVNLLDGKLGHDTLTGNAGEDVFRFSSALGDTNIDTLTDFEGGGVGGGDTLQLDHAIFTALSVGALGDAAFESGTPSVASTADVRIIYNTSTGAVYYDADGSDVGSDPVQFATLGVSTHPAALVAGDFLVV